MKLEVNADGRWVLGNPVATCPKCNAPAAVKYAANGRAEVWHAPTDCCDYAKARERRFDMMRRAEQDRDERRDAYLRSAA